MVGINGISLSVRSVGPATSLLLSLGRVVVWGAQRLPVRPIIEEIVVALMWSDMVHDGGRCRPALVFAVLAKGMIPQIGGAALTPLLCGVKAAPFLGF